MADRQNRVDRTYRAAKRAASRSLARGAKALKDAVVEAGTSAINTVAEAAEAVSLQGGQITARRIAEVVMTDAGLSVENIGTTIAVADTAANIGQTVMDMMDTRPDHHPRRNPAIPGGFDKEAMAMMLQAFKQKRAPRRRAYKRPVYQKKYVRKTYKRRSYQPRRYVKNRYYRRRY